MMVMEYLRKVLEFQDHKIVAVLSNVKTLYTTDMIYTVSQKKLHFLSLQESDGVAC